MAQPNLKDPRKASSLVEIFRANWWMVTFLSILAVFSWQSMRKKQLIAGELRERLDAVMDEKRLAIQERDDLILQIRSQDDPQWVELVLMRRLGLVPEGQVKVYFDKQ